MKFRGDWTGGPKGRWRPRMKPRKSARMGRQLERWTGERIQQEDELDSALRQTEDTSPSRKDRP